MSARRLVRPILLILLIFYFLVVLFNLIPGRYFKPHLQHWLHMATGHDWAILGQVRAHMGPLGRLTLGVQRVQWRWQAVPAHGLQARRVSVRLNPWALFLMPGRHIHLSSARILGLRRLGASGGVSSDIRGNLKIDRPRGDMDWQVIAELNSRYLNYDTLSFQGSKPKTPQLFNTTPLPLRWLRWLNLKISYTAKQFQIHQAHLARLKFTVWNEAGKLKISPLKARLGAGLLTGRLKLSAKDWRWRAWLKAQAVGAPQFYKLIGLGPHLHKGKVSGHLMLQGTGQSSRDLVSSLQGEVELGLQDSYYQQRYGGQFARLLAGGSRHKGIRLNCFVGQARIRDGVIKSKALVLDTKGATVLGKGEVDLAKETISLLLVPRAKGLGLADVATTMRLSGDLSKLRFYPAPEALAKTAAKTVLGVFTGVGLVGSLTLEALEATLLKKKKNICQALISKPWHERNL